jgi:FAD/FMN-containing dehydrogenase
VPADTFATALAELTAALGADAVLTKAADKAEFRDPFQSEQWTASWPGAVVQPTTPEQVQDVVRITVRQGIPLLGQGQGRNNGYGARHPASPGASPSSPVG